MIYLVILIIANLFGYGIPFMTSLLLIQLVSETKRGSRVHWLQNLRAHLAFAACVALATGVVVPVGVNIGLHHHRAELWQGDIAWTERLNGVHRPALLFRPDAIWARYRHGRVQDAKELESWRSLLLTHVVDAVLVGLPPGFGKDPDPASPVVRYRLERRPWCPSVPSTRSYEAPGYDELFRMALGQCVVGEPATLADADTVLSVQLMPDNDIPADYSSETLMANRLSLYRHEGSVWRLLHRETAVGGMDWLVPAFIFGPKVPARAVGAGAELLTVITGDPAPLKIDPWMTRWGLSGQDKLAVDEADRRATARQVLADSTIPSDSASVQFLAFYVWVGGWAVKDLQLVADILHDPRVTQFPYVLPGPRGSTPPVLARPLAERILTIELPPSRALSHPLSRNRDVVDALASLISELPVCGPTSIRDLIAAGAQDEERRSSMIKAVFAVQQDATRCHGGLPDLGNHAVGSPADSDARPHFRFRME